MNPQREEKKNEFIEDDVRQITKGKIEDEDIEDDIENEELEDAS